MKMVNNCSDCKTDVDATQAVKVAAGKERKDGDAAPDTWRCKPCHNVRSRMNRLFIKSPELKDAWSAFPSYEKNDFIAASHAHFGADLSNSLTFKIRLLQTKLRKVNLLISF